jgi:hypothetical protein
VVVAGPPHRAGRVAAAAQRLGLPACALAALDGLRDLRLVLAGLAATPREGAPALTELQ